MRGADLKRNHGFTLVELLVVIAIISVLAAMLLPTLERGLMQARLLTCANNLRQHYFGFTFYTNDFGDHMPSPADGIYANWLGTYEAPTPPNRWAPERKLMNSGVFYALGYFQDPNVFFCPDNPLSTNLLTRNDNRNALRNFQRYDETGFTIAKDLPAIGYMHRGPRNQYNRWPTMIDYTNAFQGRSARKRPRCDA